MNILVVEDQLLYRDIFCQLLQFCYPQARISVADEGTTALSLTRMVAFDLIITDYQLGAITGGDVVRHLRQRASSANQTLPPIVVMSSQPEVRVFARSMGADGFLSKPVEEEELRQVVDPLVQHDLQVGHRVTRDVLPSIGSTSGNSVPAAVMSAHRRLWQVDVAV